MAGQRDGEPTIVWERPEPPSRAALSPLSRESIVRAAIGLADAEGLDAVSLRKVAAVLDAGPMRLYGYLSTKEELLALMADAVYGEIPAPGAGLDWRGALRFLAHQTRNAARRHEWFADLLGGRPALGPHAMARTEALLAALDGVAGFEDINTVMHAGRAVSAYLIGAIRTEIAELRAERATGKDKARWQAAAGPYVVRMLATGRFPATAKMIRDADDPSPDAAFDAGLDYVLDGIAARVLTDG